MLSSTATYFDNISETFPLAIDGLTLNNLSKLGSPFFCHCCILIVMEAKLVYAYTGREEQ